MRQMVLNHLSSLPLMMPSAAAWGLPSVWAEATSFSLSTSSAGTSSRFT